jgi:hypothetical protein
MRSVSSIEPGVSRIISARMICVGEYKTSKRRGDGGTGIQIYIYINSASLEIKIPKQNHGKNLNTDLYLNFKT